MIYAEIIKRLGVVNKILEIGIGSTNTNIVSNMGKKGKPGASLRAFNTYFKNALIYGLDIDKTILFNENGIKTFFVDQTKPETFDKLSKKIGNQFDLMIDDGLHSPNANLHSLIFFINHIRKGGYIVIEDINQINEPIWKIVSNLIEPKFVSAFIKTKLACIFVAHRIN